MAERGPDHAKEFTVEVTIGGEAYGRGEGLSKQVAAQAAAEALERLAADGKLEAKAPPDETNGAAPPAPVSEEALSATKNA